MNIRKHKPVLLQEVVDAMPDHCRFVLDGTLGHGGHTQAMLNTMRDAGNVDARVVGVDRDEKMIEKAEVFLGEDMNGITIVQGSYAEFEKIVNVSNIEKFDYMLIDIGVNMDHFKEADRGFSLKLDGALDMRYDTTKGVSVAQWLEKSTYQDLIDLFTMYTDFTSKYIETLAKELVVAKKKSSFLTTYDLRDRAKETGIGDKKLAVLFQAFRIIVNDELGELEKFLQFFPKYIQPGGRCVVISYHSGEDRRVKNALKTYQEQGIGKNLTKHVIKPKRTEVEKNRAARSAKMRVFEMNM